MTLDEAIKHATEVAEENQAVVDSCDYYGENMAKCEECAKEHRQLAAWLRELKQLREQMNSSEEPNKWIPVSESMPPIGQDVLVCDLDGDMYITYLHLNGTWGFDYCGNKIKNVVAWQELPAPYKAESEDTDD